MTQKDKELSFIDISGRLHYGVIVNYKENEYDHHKWKITNLHTLSYSQSGTIIDTDYDGWIGYEEQQGCGMSSGSRPFRFGEVLPYLRPMSSMTPKERHEVQEILGPGIEIDNGFIDILDSSIHTFSFLELKAVFDWLNAHHFDYNNLIERRLAIAVTKENNPYN